jgi:ppGpp synthetase/RelA/SpoT-type nucleotidyltranferase
MKNENLISDMDKQQLNEIRIALEQSIVSKLEKAGIYHRSVSRLKSETSLAGKLATGKYENGENAKKVQDIIGIRINLFFFEDINICEDIINETYKVDNWSRTKRQDNRFEAQKRNCVCKLPSKYVKKISPELWDNAVDQTFEVQLRTLLFEGWHEIEHDMRYKNKYGKAEKNALSGLVQVLDSQDEPRSIDAEEHKLSRVMNSVIANLELCDWSLVEIYDRLAAVQVSHKDWERAFQSRYRLNMAEGNLCRSIREYFDENPDIAQRFYEVDKKNLVDAMLEIKGNPQLTLNRLVYHINKSFVHDTYIEEELTKLPHGKENVERVTTEIKPLTPFYVFRQDIYIAEDGFNDAADIIYRWAREHMKLVFPQIPENVCTCTYETIGHKLIINADMKKKIFNMDMQHISSSEAGLVWHITARLSMKNKGLKFTTRNVCESYSPKHRSYNRPEFVRDIYSNVGMTDAGYIVKENVHATRLCFDELSALVHNPDRQLPVVVVSRMPEKPEWATSFEGYVINIRVLRRSLGGLCHFVKADSECMTALKEVFAEFNLGIEQGGVLFWKQGEYVPQVFTMEDIHKSDFEETRRVLNEDSQYEKAFRFQLKELVREEFVE